MFGLKFLLIFHRQLLRKNSRHWKSDNVCFHFFFNQTLPIGGMRPAVRRPVLLPVLLCTPPHTLRYQKPRQNDGRWPLL